jgi:hypothetical protein
LKWIEILDGFIFLIEFSTLEDDQIKWQTHLTSLIVLVNRKF